jgi:hypothetical protein
MKVTVGCTGKSLNKTPRKLARDTVWAGGNLINRCKDSAWARKIMK